jgi:hypothetical protein
MRPVVRAECSDGGRKYDGCLDVGATVFSDLFACLTSVRPALLADLLFYSHRAHRRCRPAFVSVKPTAIHRRIP